MYNSSLCSVCWAEKGKLLIVFSHVTKVFAEEKVALRDVSFSVERGETLVLLGQSGCGKTSALRLINRLIQPTSGTIFVNGADVSTLDPIELRRSIGYAIQHIGLFPHMTIEENVGVVPKLIGWSEKKIRASVDELLQMVGLEPSQFLKRYPRELSGGQKQRVGVARALAADPPIILMDEPFGALDPISREQLQNEFLEIQSRIHKTVVFVTHDLSEAVKMGDRIAIFRKGEIIQIASPKEILENPANTFIDDFLGKDRLSLLLQRQTLLPLLDRLNPAPTSEEGKLDLRSSLIDSLMTFKLTGSESLPIYDEEKYLGELARKTLLEELLTLI